MVTATIKAPSKNGRSRTGPQILYRPVDYVSKNTGVLDEYHRGTLTYLKIREMRKDPTIAMVRQLIVAPALMAPWSFKERKGAPSGSGEFIKEQLEELRPYLVRTCLFGCIDYGWQSFEKIFGTDDKGKIVLKKMKALIPDYTDILINVNNGAYMGLREWNILKGVWTYIRRPKGFVHSFDVEGTYWYGHSYMSNVENPYDQWSTANDANVRYDEKIAGSHWVIHYPMGTSTVNGEEKDNQDIAQEILGALQSSGGIAVPKKIEEFINELDKETPNAWEIELLSDKGATQTNFLERMAYLDKLKVRAFGFPERSILEGKYGTKAEAETHADFAVTNILLRTNDLIRDLNWHLVDQLLELNWGPEKRGTVRIEPGSIGSDNRTFLRQVYMELLKNPDGFIAEFAHMDMESLREILLVPTDTDMEGTDLFEKKLEKLEEKADKDEDENNGLFNEDGLGDALRPGQRPEMGRPLKPGGSDRDQQPGNMGDLSSGREDRRQNEEESVRSSSSDDVSNRD